MRHSSLCRSSPVLDAVLQVHASEIGRDFSAYRNHAYRVLNLCMALCPEISGEVEKVSIAAACHDLGIWTDRTFDYLAPSVKVANGYLAGIGKMAWSPEIERMILEHHKLSSYKSAFSQLVETFRRADWIDVSRGLITFGLPRELLKEVFATWPDAGFRWRLAQLSAKQLVTHPWSPLPMVRL